MISLLLVDDWELRGDGSGDMEHIQFSTLSQLLEIYESRGLKASINAEVMQQIHHLRLGREFPHLGALAARWETVVTDAYRRGHDVQLHVHSQWEGARYEGGKWILPGNWSILTSPRGVMARMIQDCKEYLETLLRKVDPNYRCVSFRSGAWAIAPNADILAVLAEVGIVFDMSIVSGIRYDNSVISLDYRKCDEPFLPYYPSMNDARRISEKEEPIVCVPTLSFRPSRSWVLKQDLRRIANRLQKNRQSAPDEAQRQNKTQARGDYEIWKTQPPSIVEKLVARCFPPVGIADLSALNFSSMKEMVGAIRKKARQRRVDYVPVILENHTKDIKDFSDIKRFVEYISREKDIEVITLTELAHRLQAGVYPRLTKTIS